MKLTTTQLLLITILLIIGCSSKLEDPQKIVDNAISYAGGEKFQKSVIQFDFRGRHYIARRDGGSFSYERIFKDSLDTIHDIFSNDGFQRKINGEPVAVPDTMAVKYTSSTNSVNYFALLPYRLNDDAVIKKYLGETVIKDKAYYKIQITFRQEGGGEDHEDVYLYWFDQENFAMDYLAYSFEESDETSFRFREACNPRVVNGIRFQDYVNYKPKNNSLSVEQAENLYKEGELVKLSNITTENISVD